MTAAKDGYETATRTVDVRPGNVTTVHLTTASTSAVGSVTGRVLDQAAQPLPGVTVTVADGDRPLATATSGPDGAFTVADVPMGTGYTIRAEAAGYVAATRSGLNVEVVETPGGKSVKLTRTANSGSTSLSQTFALKGLPGLPGGRGGEPGEPMTPVPQ